MFDPQDHLSRLIGAIYDTVIDPGAWPGVLREIGDFAQAARMTLILEDARQPMRSAMFASYEDPDWARRYVESYMLINPMRLATEPFVKAGDVMLTTDFTTPQEYAASRIAREFLAPRGLVDIASAILEKTGDTITVLSFKRDVAQGYADEALRRRASLLLPHVRRAASISRALEFHAGRLSAFAEAFDHLEAAIFLLDEEARILERNRSAADLLASAGPLAAIEGRLSLRDPAARAEFDSSLRLAAAGRTLAGDGAALTLKAEAKLYSAALMPLRGGESGLRLAGAKAAALFCVREVRFAPTHAMANLARLYNLTRRECAVMLATVEIGGAREAAAALGLSENTVKSHLKAVFHKTRTSRQSDLVKLLAAAALPLG